MSAAETLNLVEIFSSVQGEGIHVGASTLFVRLGECDLRCRWCDTPHSWKPAAACRIETLRGAAEFREVPNPVPLPAIVAAAEALEWKRHRFVSFTGGEPLLQPDALGALAQRLHGHGPGLHLETHGLHADALASLVEWIDVVSMDWKLASDVRRASDPRAGVAGDFHGEHAAFLEVARRHSQVYVKVVVTPATRTEELDAMTAAVAAIDVNVPVVVQPVTPFGACREAPESRTLLEWVSRIGERLVDVRLIPQTHKLIGAL